MACDLFSRIDCDCFEPRMGSGLSWVRFLVAFALVDTFPGPGPGVTSSFRFLSVHDATSMLCNLFLPLLVALVVVDVVATPLVVAVVDDVAFCPSSTRLMSSGEAGVLTPTPSG